VISGVTEYWPLVRNMGDPERTGIRDSPEFLLTVLQKEQVEAMGIDSSYGVEAIPGGEVDHE
jgi:hypothetical protein